MRRVGRNAAIAAAAGCCLGALQIVRENRGEWDAVHATLLTIVIQTGAGALVGGAFLAVIMVTLLSRRRPGGLVARRRGWIGRRLRCARPGRRRRVHPRRSGMS